MSQQRSPKARLKGAAVKAAPPGSNLRAAMRVARQVLFDGRGYLPRARALWRLASEPAAVEPEYGDWYAVKQFWSDDSGLFLNVGQKTPESGWIVLGEGTGP